MRQGRSTGTPTPAQLHRFAEIQRLGCVCCRLNGDGFVQCEIHHLNEGDHHGQLRKGHDETVGLCPWHHRGVCRERWTPEDMVAAYGPSWEQQPSAFRARYGGAERLLKYQDDLLMLWA